MPDGGQGDPLPRVPGGGAWSNVVAMPVCGIVAALAAYLTRDKLGRAISGWWHRHLGHRPELELFHTRKIVLERRRGGTRLVSDIHLEEDHSRGLIRRWLQRNREVVNHDAAGRSGTPENQIVESLTLAPQ